jgi:hypothetical protein
MILAQGQKTKFIDKWVTSDKFACMQLFSVMHTQLVSAEGKHCFSLFI